MKLAEGAKEGRFPIARHAWSGGGKTVAPRGFLLKSGIRPPLSFPPARTGLVGSTLRLKAFGASLSFLAGAKGSEMESRFRPPALDR